MNHSRLWAAAAIIAFLIIAGFVFSVPHTREVAQVSPSSAVVTVPPVALHDVFRKGMHTITGSVEAPNACTTVAVQASLQGNASSTESILVAVSLSSSTGVCLQLPTTLTFSTAIAAPAHLPLSATVNGAAASTTSS